jgi:hypothetical protein
LVVVVVVVVLDAVAAAVAELARARMHAMTRRCMNGRAVS